AEALGPAKLLAQLRRSPAEGRGRGIARDGRERRRGGGLGEQGVERSGERLGHEGAKDAEQAEVDLRQAREGLDRDSLTPALDPRVPGWVYAQRARNDRGGELRNQLRQRQPAAADTAPLVLPAFQRHLPR